MDRPPEIRRFASFGGVACLVNAAATMLLMDFNRRAVLGGLISVALVIGMILWVTLGRSALGRVAVTIWLAFITGSGLGSYALLLAGHRLAAMDPALHVFSLVTIAANCLALYFLWTATATAWLQKEADIS